MLRNCPLHFEVAFCGPSERTRLSSEALARVSLYAQPGGGDDLGAAWRAMRPHAESIRGFVAGGGRYLGICMGGYLAGRDPGFALLAGDSGDYTTTRGAQVRTSKDSIVTVQWLGRPVHLYYQDGPYFELDPGAEAEVVGTYTNSRIAAAVTRFGKGSVGVCGPHPEADRSWYRAVGLPNPYGVDPRPGYELVVATVGAGARSG